MPASLAFPGVDGLHRMTLDAQRRETLLKTVRGKSFRRALKAIAELRAADQPALAEIVGAYRAPDGEREMHYRIARIVLAHGARGLVAEWGALADPKWRAELIIEIEQAFALWVDEATVDLLLTALEDPSPEVRGKAVWGLVGIVRDVPDRERRTARADSHRRALAALDTLRGWMTAARRARATRGLVEMLVQHRQAPCVVLAQIVETLGHTATKDDQAAVQALEALGPESGEPFRVTYEALDESKLDWRERLLAERKGIEPGRIKVRIGHHPTGLLDRKVLAAALERIQGRALH
jgi:hypothetical protein